MPDSIALFLTAAAPVLQAGTIMGAGAVLAGQGILDHPGSSMLAQVVFNSFLPALTFTTLGKAITIDSIRHLWPLLVNMAISILVGLWVGHIVAKKLGVPSQLRPLLTCACAFANVGNLPLVFVGALCADKDTMFHAELGERCEPLGIAYTAFDICIASLLQFTIGLQMLKPPTLNTHEGEDNAGLEYQRPPNAEMTTHHHLHLQRHCNEDDYHGDARVAIVDIVDHQNGTSSRGSDVPRDLNKLPTVSDLLDSPSQWPTRNNSSAGATTSTPDSLTPREIASQSLELQPIRWQEEERSMHDSTRPFQLPGEVSIDAERPVGEETALMVHHRSHKHDHSAAHVIGEMRDGDSSSEHGSRTTTIGVGKSVLALRRRIWKWLRAVEWKAAFPLPTQAAFAGILVGCIPPLRALVFGERAVLKPLTAGLETLSDGLIPSALPLLGATLYRGPGGAGLKVHVIFWVSFTRLVLLPAIMTALVAACVALKVFPVPDSMFVFSLFLASSTPTAVNMQTLTVVYGHGAEEMSQLLFWQYIASLVTLPGWMWAHMHLIEYLV